MTMPSGNARLLGAGGLQLIVAVIDGGHRPGNIARLERDLRLPESALLRWPGATGQEPWVQRALASCNRTSFPHKALLISAAHIGLWRHVARELRVSGADAVAIFEDDALFVPAQGYSSFGAFEETLRSWITPRWNLPPGDAPHKAARPRALADFTQLGWCGLRQCLQGYLLTRRGVSLMLEGKASSVCGEPIDTQLSWMSCRTCPMSYARAPPHVFNTSLRTLGAPGGAVVRGLVIQQTLDAGPTKARSR